MRTQSLILSFILALLVAACGDDKETPVDSGARVDSGSTASDLDAGALSADSSSPADAQSIQDSGGVQDSGMMGTDAETKDALPSADVGFSDAGFFDGGTISDSGLMDAQPSVDAGFADTGVLIGTQTGELVITEIMGVTSNLEWVELRNVSAQAIDVRLYHLEFDSKPGVLAYFYEGTDPTGTSTAPLMLPAGDHAYFVLNPMDPSLIPSGAHVYGVPGQFGGNSFQDNGDRLTLSTNTQVVDTLDMTTIATLGDRNITAGQFPVITDQSTQLSSPLSGGLGANANDFGSAWCSPTWRGATPGAMNHDCNWFVISEVLYDYDSLSGGGDNGYEFVEIAGPAGAYLQDLQVAAIQGSSSNAGAVVDADILSGLRMPGNGLYVLADQSSAGQTQVANPDQIVDLQLQNGPDAIQLVRVTASSGVQYFDSFGYGALTPNLTDTSRMQAAYEGTPVPDMATRIRSVNWARSLNQTDTQDNLADFSHDPSPSPGAPNLPSVLKLNLVEPSNALASDTATVSFIGADFTDFMEFDLDGQSIDVGDCTDLGANEVQCLLSFSSTVASAPLRQDVNAQSRVEHGQTAQLVGGLTWSVSVNGTGDPSEIDYCNIQFPSTLTVRTSSASELIYGRVYESGITDLTIGESSEIVAELGYGPTNEDPRYSNTWKWDRAAFNLDYGNDDEYQGVLMVTTPGSYNYTYRFSMDEGLSWTVCDIDGAGSDPMLDYSPMQLGSLTVTP